MKTIKLYRFIRPDGGVTVSPVKPNGEYTGLFRLIAEDGKVLTDGKIITNCIDTADPDLFTEIDEVEQE